MELFFELIFGCGNELLCPVPLVIAGLVAAAAGAAGTGVTRKNQKSELNKMRARIANDQASNKSWYNANYISDYTQRADAQNLFKHLRDNLKRNREITAATAAVTGATPAAQAAAKEADTRAISDTYSNVSAIGQRYKDNLTDKYFRRQDMLNARMMGIDQKNLEGYDRMSQSWSNLMGTGLNVASGAYANEYAGMNPVRNKGKLTTSQNIAQQYLNSV